MHCKLNEADYTNINLEMKVKKEDLLIPDHTGIILHIQQPCSTLIVLYTFIADSRYAYFTRKLDNIQMITYNRCP